MGMKVPYGEVDLKKIRTEGYIYIDKTMYIEKLSQIDKVDEDKIQDKTNTGISIKS